MAADQGRRGEDADFAVDFFFSVGLRAQAYGMEGTELLGLFATLN